MNDPLSLTCLNQLNSASKYLCFTRIWWDGTGVDTVFSWKDDRGFFQRILMTGEMTTLKDQRLVLDQAITEEYFSKLLDEFAALNIEGLPSQHKKRALTHFDDWYGIKRVNRQAGHWLKIAGGIHSLPQGERLLDFIDHHFPVVLTGSAD